MSASGESLFTAKFRVVSRAFSAVISERRFLNPLRFGRLSWALWSHKVIRWIVPFILPVHLCATAALAATSPMRFWFWAQIAFYGAAFVGRLIDLGSGRPRWFFIPYYFCVVNLAAACGVIGAILGRRIPLWKPDRSYLMTSTETR